MLQLLPFSTFEICCCVKCAAFARSFWLSPAFLRASCSRNETSRSSFSSSYIFRNFSSFKDSLRCDLSVFICSSPEAGFSDATKKIVTKLHCFPYLPGWDSACVLRENVSNDNEIPVAEEIQKPGLIPPELHPQLMNSVFEKVRVRTWKMGTTLLKFLQKGENFPSLPLLSLLNEVMNLTTPLRILIVKHVPRLSWFLDILIIHHFRCMRKKNTSKKLKQYESGASCADNSYRPPKRKAEVARAVTIAQHTHGGSAVPQPKWTCPRRHSRRSGAALPSRPFLSSRFHLAFGKRQTVRLQSAHTPGAPATHTATAGGAGWYLLPASVNRRSEGRHLFFRMSCFTMGTFLRGIRTILCQEFKTFVAFVATVLVEWHNLSSFFSLNVRQRSFGLGAEWNQRSCQTGLRGASFLKSIG